jgi:hypothetical protein
MREGDWIYPTTGILREKGSSLHQRFYLWSLAATEVSQYQEAQLQDLLLLYRTADFSGAVLRGRLKEDS